MILQFSLNITACVPDYHNETSFSSSSRDLIVSSSCGAFSFLPFLLFPSFFCTQAGGLVSSFFVGLLDSLYNDEFDASSELLRSSFIFMSWLLLIEEPLSSFGASFPLFCTGACGC